MPWRALFFFFSCLSAEDGHPCYCWSVAKTLSTSVRTVKISGKRNVIQIRHLSRWVGDCWSTPVVCQVVWPRTWCQYIKPACRKGIGFPQLNWRCFVPPLPAAVNDEDRQCSQWVAHHPSLTWSSCSVPLEWWQISYTLHSAVCSLWHWTVTRRKVPPALSTSPK